MHWQQRPGRATSESVHGGERRCREGEVSGRHKAERDGTPHPPIPHSPDVIRMVLSRISSTFWTRQDRAYNVWLARLQFPPIWPVQRNSCLQVGPFPGLSWSKIWRYPPCTVAKAAHLIETPKHLTAMAASKKTAALGNVISAMVKKDARL